MEIVCASSSATFLLSWESTWLWQLLPLGQSKCEWPALLGTVVFSSHILNRIKVQVCSPVHYLFCQLISVNTVTVTTGYCMAVDIHTSVTIPIVTVTINLLQIILSLTFLSLKSLREGFKKKGKFSTFCG